ncbi:MAG: hypothetical protein EDM75_12125 [Chlorobiota bacterium]|nr:MAG: hypothetical protein EDM75_12125 [Chlorobiota bacterium]
MFIVFLVSTILVGAQKKPDGDNGKQPAFLVLEKGKLTLIDENGKNLKKIKIKDPVFDFVWVDPTTVFYSVLKKKTLQIFKLDPVSEAVKKIAEIKSTSNNTKYWMEGDEFSMSFIKKMLYVKCDYYEEFPYGFLPKKVYEIDPGSGKNRIIEMDQFFAIQSDTTSAETTKPEPDAGLAKIRAAIQVNSDCELEYTGADGRTKVITKTTDEKIREDGYDCVSFDVLPGGKKVIFFVFGGVGDFIHGPVYLVNLDGSQQKRIIDDVVDGPFVFAIEGSGKIFNIRNKDKSRDLISFKDDNSAVVLRTGIKKIEPCRKIVWTFSF